MNPQELSSLKEMFAAADAENQTSSERKAMEIRALEAYVQELEDNVFAPLFFGKKRKKRGIMMGDGRGLFL